MTKDEMVGEGKTVDEITDLLDMSWVSSQSW